MRVRAKGHPLIAVVPVRTRATPKGCLAALAGLAFSCLKSKPNPKQQERPAVPQSPGIRFAAEPLSFIVRHQLWDGNVEDHVDQGISIDVVAAIVGKETVLLRFNCVDIERSYVYGPENPELSTPLRVG